MRMSESRRRQSVMETRPTGLLVVRICRGSILAARRVIFVESVAVYVLEVPMEGRPSQKDTRLVLAALVQISVGYKPRAPLEEFVGKSRINRPLRFKVRLRVGGWRPRAGYLLRANSRRFSKPNLFQSIRNYRNYRMCWYAWRASPIRTSN